MNKSISIFLLIFILYVFSIFFFPSVSGYIWEKVWLTKFNEVILNLKTKSDKIPENSSNNEKIKDEDNSEEDINQNDITYNSEEDNTDNSENYDDKEWYSLNEKYENTKWSVIDFFNNTRDKAEDIKDTVESTRESIEEKRKQINEIKESFEKTKESIDSLSESLNAITN